MNSTPASSARLPVSVQPPSGRGRSTKSRLACLAFVLGEVTVGIGECLPGAGSTLELVERLPDGVVEEGGCVAFQALPIRCVGWRRCGPSTRIGRHRRRRRLQRPPSRGVHCAGGRSGLGGGLPDRRARHMCLMTVFAEKNPCDRNGLWRSTAPAAATTAASTERRSSSIPTSHARSSIASSSARSTSPSAATATSARRTASAAALAGGFGVDRLRPGGAGSRRDTRQPTTPRRCRPRESRLKPYRQS